MNKNGKKLFIILFGLVLFLITFLTISMYDNFKANKSRYDNIMYYFAKDFQYYTLDLVKQVNPSFQALSFSEEIPESVQTQMTNEFLQSCVNSQSFFMSDNDFYYAVKDLETGNTLTNVSSESINPNDYSYYVDIKYDENGNCTLDGDITRDIFSNIDMLLYNQYSTYDVTVNKPRNVEIQYMLAADMTSYDGISGYVNSWENYNSFSAIAFCLGSVVLVLFFLIYPIQYVEETNPFKAIKNWCIEIHFCFLIMIVSLAFLFCLLLSGYTLNGYFLQVFQNYGIENGKQILIIINYIGWILGYIMVSMGIFECKYVIVYGPLQFIKDHSLISLIIHYIHRHFNVLADIHLTNSLNKKILKYVFINALVIILIGIFDFYLVFFLTLFYSIFLFFIIKKNIFIIQNDYQKLMNSIRHLISEDFSKNEDENFGIFESSKKELEKLSDNFENAVQEKVKSEKLKTELISNVSHDLKTPLTCIKNYVAVLDDDNLTLEKRHEYLDKVKMYANRLKILIEDLLEISKVDSGNIQLEFVNLNIIDLLEQVYSQTEEFFESRDLTIIRKYPDNKIMLNLDSQKTYRIFENLLMNISKYAMPHSRAYMTIKEDETSVLVEISNISEEPMNFTTEEIMERFVRGDKSRSQQGSGLGLAIARSFTEAQGGTFALNIDCDLFKVLITFLKHTE